MSKVIASLYEISHELGVGGAGTIYMGWHLRLEKSVVLKADKRNLFKHRLESLRREVEMLKDVNHTYIPPVYDFLQEDGIFYTVMDYIEGESFDKPLKRGEHFTSQQVVCWAKQVLEALVYLHSRPPYGILHSDIKPSNIILTPQGDIRLIDFNIALALGADGAVSVGRTRPYASPEHYGIDYSIEAASVNTNGSSIVKTTTSSSAATVVETDGRTVFSSSDDNIDLNNDSINSSSDNIDFDNDNININNNIDIINDKINISSDNADIGGVKQASVSTGGSKKTIILDARSDIYGLGATLYHLLSGCRPAQYAADVEPLTSQDCPYGLAAIINKAMSPDRNLRFQTAEEMLSAFENIHRNDPRSRRFRRLRSLTAAVLALTLIIGSFTAFTGLKRMQWGEKTKALVVESQNAYSKGNISDAVRLALEAIPAKSDLFTPPVTASAKKALADALGVYDLSDGYKLYKTVSLPSVPLMADISPDRTTAAVVYAYETAIVDLESGGIRFTLPLIRSALAEARFLNNTTLICAGQDGICAYDISSEAAPRIWGGSIASTIAISADGETIAAINRDDDFAVLYDAKGEKLAQLSFNGRRQHAAVNDSFTNPRDNVFALSGDGQFLAVSFEDGSFSVYDTLTQEELINITPFEEKGYVRFEGSFSGELLALSATSAQGSDFVVFDMNNIDIENPAPLGSFESTSRFGVCTNENGVFVSSENIVIQLDPLNGEQREISWVESDVTGFAAGTEYAVVAMDGGCVFFDKNGRLISRHDWDYPTDILLISGDFALIGGRDMLDMTVLKLERHKDTELLAFDPAYRYHEARVNEDGSRYMLFSAEGFRLYDGNGALICEQSIPGAELVSDQQYSKASGNLAVMYEDALRIYSGNSGEMIFEETGLRSVFYAPYGVSVLDTNGLLRRIDLDSGEAAFSANVGVNQDYAAYCGIIVDTVFLAGRKLIGAVKTVDDYLFAVSDGVNGTVYDGSGKQLFDFPVRNSTSAISADEAEAFFTGTALVISPMHSPAAAFSLKNGERIAYLEKDAYLTYVSQVDEYIVSRYISTDGEQYGLLLDSQFRPIAALPRLSDTWDGKLIFGYPQGVLRQSDIYTMEELLDLTLQFTS